MILFTAVVSVTAETLMRVWGGGKGDPRKLLVEEMPDRLVSAEEGTFTVTSYLEDDDSVVHIWNLILW